MYADIVDKTILPLIIQVGNASNLILDPDLDSYYAIDTVITKMPKLVQLIGQALETIDHRLQRAVNETLSLRGKLSLPIRTHIEEVQDFDDMLRRQVLNAGPSDFAKIDLKSVSVNGLNTLDSSYALYDASVGVLDDLLATPVGDSTNAGQFR